MIQMVAIIKNRAFISMLKFNKAYNTYTTPCHLSTTVVSINTLIVAGKSPHSNLISSTLIIYILHPIEKFYQHPTLPKKNTRENSKKNHYHRFWVVARYPSISGHVDENEELRIDCWLAASWQSDPSRFLKPININQGVFTISKLTYRTPY